MREYRDISRRTSFRVAAVGAVSGWFGLQSASSAQAIGRSGPLGDATSGLKVASIGGSTSLAPAGDSASSGLPSATPGTGIAVAIPALLGLSVPNTEKTLEAGTLIRLSWDGDVYDAAESARLTIDGVSVAVNATATRSVDGSAHLLERTFQVNRIIPRGSHIELLAGAAKRPELAPSTLPADHSSVIDAFISTGDGKSLYGGEVGRAAVDRRSWGLRVDVAWTDTPVGFNVSPVPELITVTALGPGDLPDGDAEVVIQLARRLVGRDFNVTSLEAAHETPRVTRVNLSADLAEFRWPCTGLKKGERVSFLVQAGSVGNASQVRSLVPQPPYVGVRALREGRQRFTGAESTAREFGLYTPEGSPINT